MKRAGPSTRSAIIGTLLFVVAWALPVGGFRANAQAEQSVDASRKLARDLAASGEQLRRRGNLSKAEAAFREALSLDPTSLAATLGLARTARSRFEYAEALNHLNRVKHNRDSAELLTEYGFLYLAAEEPTRARGYFDEALKRDQSSISATVGRAGVDLLEREYAKAEARLRDCLKSSPRSSRALVMMGRVLLERNKNNESEAYAEEALSLDPFDADAIHLLAFTRAAARKPEEVRSLALRGLALDPFSAGLRRMLSSYLNGQEGYRQQVSEAARRHYERGRTLKQDGKLREAVAEFEAALRIEPRYYRALTALGDIWLREGDHRRAAAAASFALQVDPEGAVAHLELSYAYLGMQEEARLEIGGEDFEAAFYAGPSASALDQTARVFPDYSTLTRRQQVVIDRTVAPLAQFLPKLVASHARHYLLPFDLRLSDVRADHADERKTFDGRYYASVRGAGGRITVSGIEYIDMAARCGANIIAHEFAHQVHSTALGIEDVRLIRKLYEQAVREERTLDFYAAANESEYFAQGYEAFVSIRKRPAASVTARHTNKELSERDPELYRLFVRLSEGSRNFGLRISDRGFGDRAAREVLDVIHFPPDPNRQSAIRNPKSLLDAA
jgi:tetratricopeptide (TPR) repeat protein